MNSASSTMMCGKCGKMYDGTTTAGHYCDGSFKSATDSILTTTTGTGDTTTINFLQAGEFCPLTMDESLVRDKLAEAWNAFLQLPQLHPDDTPEFRQGVNRLQDLLLSRTLRRLYPNL